MHNLLTRGMTEGAATEEILDACRANERFENRGRVIFRRGRSVIAQIYDEENNMLATAIVDSFDN